MLGLAEGAHLSDKLTPLAAEVADWYLANVPADRFWADLDVAWASTNGQPAALLSRDGAVIAVLTGVRPGLIRRRGVTNRHAARSELMRPRE
jgi:hypothetical protein